MPLPLGSLLALPREDRAHLDALISEAAVGRALRAEGHHVASFGLWALRRRAWRQDVLERLLRQPRDWTWLVFAPMPPGQLPAADAELLARTVQGLHGVQYVEWTVQEGALSFTSRSLRTTVVRGSPVLLPSPPRPEGSLTLPAGPLLPDLSRWAGVPAEQLGAALIEAAYIERLAPAHRGAFTNVDVLALAGEVPVVIEVKRRARTPEQETQPLTMTPTQAGTLGYLRVAGCEVHVAVLVVPKGSTWRPDLALGCGTWHAGAPVIRPGWGEMHVDLLGAAQPLGLNGLRRAREHAALGDLGLGTLPEASPSHAEPLPAVASEWASLPSCGGTAPELKGPQRLISFTSEYSFLRVWAPAPVKLGGRVYPSPAAAFLAARTLDQTAREALTETLPPVRALRLADLAPVRADWRELRHRWPERCCGWPTGMSGRRSWWPHCPCCWTPRRCGGHRWTDCRAKRAWTCSVSCGASWLPGRPTAREGVACSAPGHTLAHRPASCSVSIRTAQPAHWRAWGPMPSGVLGKRCGWRSRHLRGRRSA